MTAGATVHISVLGPIGLATAAGAVTLSPQLTRLLGVLVAAGGEPVTAGWIAAHVVDTGTDGSAVRMAISRLRRHLGDHLASGPSGYRLVVPVDQLDSARFERFIEQARNGTPEDRIGTLNEALALWRGPAYGQFADEPWAHIAATRLDDSRADAAEGLAELMLTERPGEVPALLAPFRRLHPERERPVALIMQALTTLGRRAEALRAFHEFRTTLAERTGLLPSAGLRALETELLGDDVGTTDRLPPALTSFVGRGDELAELVERLHHSRIVTLLGVGGAGKTRLALEAAHRLETVFPDGRRMVELAPITSPDSVALAVARALGVAPPATGEIVDHVAHRIGARRMLVLVDNCEHVRSAAADVVEQLAAACPRLTVLATSREPLMVTGEEIVGVPALDADSAVRLFVERARAEAPGLRLDERQLDAVEQLCTRLDRLPLAIELAAARLRAMTPVDLLDRIADRFRLLVGGRRSPMGRHDTLRGTIDWSYDLCSPNEQAVFDRLAIFPGEFTIASAVAVAGDAKDAGRIEVLVAGLVERSLVQRVTAEDGTSRYRLLDTLRAYGQEHLNNAGTIGDARARHARHVAGVVSGLAGRYFAPDEDAARVRMRELYPDALAALDWLLDAGDWNAAARLTIAGVFDLGRVQAELAIGVRQRILEVAGSLDVLDLYARAHLTVASAFGMANLAPLQADAQLVTAALLAGRLPALPPGTVIPPHGTFGVDHSLTGAAVAAALDVLRPDPTWPTGMRFDALLDAAELCLLHGNAEPARALDAELAELADALQSRRARRSLLGLRAHAEGVAGNPQRAAELAEAALEGVTEPEWRDLLASIFLLTYRVAAGDSITGDDLRRPWDWLFRTSLRVDTFRLGRVTAMSLDALGYPEASDRVLAFLRATFADNMSDYVRAAVTRDRLLDRLLAAPPTTMTIDDVAAEVRAVAADLDRRVGLPSPR